MARTVDEDRNTEATGRNPTDMGGMAEPVTGQPGTEVNIAHELLPDVGNVEHHAKPAMTVDEIKNWRKP